jgi:hypothetical protein
MYERYTDKARQTIFFATQEAIAAKSPYIEAEHLLLGIMRCCEPELNELARAGKLRLWLPVGPRHRSHNSPPSDCIIAARTKRSYATICPQASRMETTHKETLLDFRSSADWPVDASGDSYSA